MCFVPVISVLRLLAEDVVLSIKVSQTEFESNPLSDVCLLGMFHVYEVLEVLSQ